MTARQDGFDAQREGEEAVDRLLDRLAARFGRGQILVPACADAHMPEAAGRLVPAQDFAREAGAARAFRAPPVPGEGGFAAGRAQPGQGRGKGSARPAPLFTRRSRRARRRGRPPPPPARRLGRGRRHPLSHPAPACPATEQRQDKGERPAPRRPSRGPAGAPGGGSARPRRPSAAGAGADGIPSHVRPRPARLREQQQDKRERPAPRRSSRGPADAPGGGSACPRRPPAVWVGGDVIPSHIWSRPARPRDQRHDNGQRPAPRRPSRGAADAPGGGGVRPCRLPAVRAGGDGIPSHVRPRLPGHGINGRTRESAPPRAVRLPSGPGETSSSLRSGPGLPGYGSNGMTRESAPLRAVLHAALPVRREEAAPAPRRPPAVRAGGGGISSHVRPRPARPREQRHDNGQRPAPRRPSRGAADAPGGGGGCPRRPPAAGAGGGVIPSHVRSGLPGRESNDRTRESAPPRPGLHAALPARPEEAAPAPAVRPPPGLGQTASPLTSGPGLPGRESNGTTRESAPPRPGLHAALPTRPEGRADARADLAGPARPLRLLDYPEPAEAVAEVPDGPPLRFRWRRVTHLVLRAEGPERIAAPWWREDDLSPTRDYFRVETVEGHRFWLFRAGLYGTGPHLPAWYVHGQFG